MKRRQTGFTLIELLIVIAIIGILAAIAIPNLLNAVQRGKQKRTMSDVRSLAVGIEAYNVDNNVYPDSAAVCPPVGTMATGLTVVGDETGKFYKHLSPTYLAKPPLKDGWGNSMFYGHDATGQIYGIASLGRDGTPDTKIVCGTTTNFNDDIIYSGGTFIQWPEGSQN